MLTTNPASLVDFLNSGASFRPVNLLTLTLQSGVVLRYTDHDIDLTISGVTYSHLLVFRRSGVVHRRGVEVDTLTIDVMPSATNLVGPSPWLVAAQAGALDFAGVQLDVGIIALTNAGAYEPWAPLNVQGTFTWFVGDLGEVSDLSAQRVKLTCKSFLARLDIKMPRNLIQPGCQHTLFSAGCGIKESAWRTTGSVATVAADQCSFTSTAAAGKASGYFDGGRLTLTNGNNANVVRKIKSHMGNVITLFAPLVWPLTVGTTFAASPGCPKTQSLCSTRFANLANFRGLPYVPVPETITG